MTGIDPEVVRIYSEKVPLEIRSAIAPLTSDKAWAVFAALLTHESMRFTDVKELFGTDSSGDITRYLKDLTIAGLIERYALTADAIGDKGRSVYATTVLGRSLMRGLYTSVLPQPKMGSVISCELMTRSLRRFHEQVPPSQFADYSAYDSTKTYDQTFNRMTYASSSS